MSKPNSIFAIPENLPMQSRVERKRFLVKLGLAWLFMMQVMMFAAPGYFRPLYVETDSIETLDAVILLFNWIGLALTIPVLFYCALPIWKGLFNAGNQGIKIIANMNLPILLGILIAFIPSAYLTIKPRGEVYFDSISMLVAFLLTARYLEFCSRQSVYTKNPSALQIELDNRSKKDILQADKLASYFVTIQVILALLTGIIWYFFIDANKAIGVTVSLFVMSCPCAMAMAVPTAYAGAHTLLLNHPHINEKQGHIIFNQTTKTAIFALKVTLIWHLLMTPLAMLGFVSPWLAALIMLVSSLWVAWYAWHHYKKLYYSFLQINSAQVA